MTWLLETLPVPLRTALVHGSEGAAHLSSCAALAAGAGLSRLHDELLLAAWAESPLDAVLAARAAAVPDAPAVARELAAYVAANTAPPGDLAYYRRLAGRRDAEKIVRYLESQAAKEPGNLFWDRLSLTHAMDGEDWERAARIAAGLPEQLARPLSGDIAMLRGDPATALANYSRCARLWEAPGLEARLGLAHLAAGDGDGARSWLSASVAREPWRTQALFALHDLSSGVRGLRSMPTGQVSVLLYTYNKAADIGRTLESLFASELGAAKVIVLDNGSTDATGGVLAAWREKAGPGRFATVDLPVNVGAPAARNWLMSLPDVRTSDWVVFLDDDVEMPPDWLGLLGAASRLYPEAGAWGARVTDHSRPAHIQSADMFIVPEEGGEGRLFNLSSCHHQTLDRGQFSYCRPCATVTGCCHLFMAERLSGGGFDLRYSPSQYDDLDHDIRLLLSGRSAACQGHLAVRHFKSTGSLGGEGQAQYGIGWANQFKLHRKFAPEDIRRAARTADEAAWADALAKWRALAKG
ncbi:MAG: glycosyltransferase [Thermodesulfobacteriota bacterium]